MFSVPHDESGGPDALAEAFLRFVPGTAIVRYGGGKAFRWSGKLAATNGRSLWRVASNHDWTFCTQTAHSPFVAVAVPESGGLTMVERGKSYDAEPGQALMLHIPAQRDLHAVSRQGHARTTLKWSIAEAERALSSVNEQVDIATMPQSPIVDLRSDRGQILARVLAAVAVDLANPGACSPLASELMHEAALRLLFESVFDSRNHRDARAGNRAVPHQVRQAIDYMRNHAGEPIRIRDVADACLVTPRALEIGFKHCKGTTPLAYLRQLRLDAVRRELEAADRPLRVGDVARRWGFADLGRFAESYRRAFGELPSQTRRNR